MDITLILFVHRYTRSNGMSPQKPKLLIPGVSCRLINMEKWSSTSPLTCRTKRKCD